MSKQQKWILGILVAGILCVILFTWGSIGSAVLTLALLLVGGFLLFKHLLETHDPEDYGMEF